MCNQVLDTDSFPKQERLMKEGYQTPLTQGPDDDMKM